MKKREASNIIGIIPARMASSRFPGKPLAKICGIPMVGHVYIRSRMSKALDAVYVATCDEEIASYISSMGGEAIMTSPLHERASDRAAEAIAKIEDQTHKSVDIVVMIQGDEPLIYPEMIGEAIKPLLEDSALDITNLMSEIKTIGEFEDPNEVKVVVDRFSNALYFSREPIPSRKKGSSKVTMLKQVCIIPFRKDFLLRYTRMSSTPLEIAESVDMLRIIENGIKVKMVFTKFNTKSVDTVKDLETVSEIMKVDPLFKKYRPEGTRVI